MDSKNNIRQFAKKFRDQLNVLPEWAEQAADNFIQSIPHSKQSVVSVYYPIGSEIDSSPIVDYLWQKNITVCLPVIQEEGRGLKFSAWHQDTKLTKRRFSVVEPLDVNDDLKPDIVIVPLLAFDQQGNRMGYGQGHYDETLRVLRMEKDVLAVGLAYAEQAVLLALPTEPHDQKLDMVVTPQRVFDFRA